MGNDSNGVLYVIAALFIWSFWVVSSTRLKTIVLFCWVQLAVSFWNSELTDTLVDIMGKDTINGHYELIHIIAPAILCAILANIYFIFKPTKFPPCSIGGAIGAFVVKAILTFFATYQYYSSPFIAADAIFIGMIYAGPYLMYPFYFTIGLYLNLSENIKVRLKAAEETKTRRRQEKQNSTIKAEQELILKKIKKDPWGEFNRLLLSLKEEVPSLKQPIENSLEQITRLYNKKTVTISIVGEFSSGKSTFINQVLDQELLKFANEECTCVPTKLSHSSNPNFNERALGKWTVIDADSFKNRQFNFDPQVDFLQAKVASDLLKNLDIELIDTPGASSKDPRYEARTLQAIEESDACIVLMDSAQDGSKSFFAFLDEVRKRQGRIYLFFSRSDMRSQPELEDHRQFTVPKLCDRLKIKPDDIHFVGLKGSDIVKTPSSVFKIIGESLREERGIILKERINSLIAKINVLLSPQLAREESDAARTLKDSMDTPASFEELWGAWLKQVETIPWDEISAEISSFCTRAHDSIWQGVENGSLRAELKGYWFNDKGRDGKARRQTTAAAEQFAQSVFDQLERTLTPHLNLIDDHANKTIFKYLETIHNIKQKGSNLAQICFHPTDQDHANLKQSKAETSIRLKIGLSIADQIAKSLSYDVPDLNYDNSSKNLAGGMAGMALNSGDPILGLIAAAATVVGGKSGADDQYWKQISNWFTQTSIDRKKAAVQMISQMPNSLKKSCADLTKQIKKSSLKLLVESKFAATRDSRENAKRRLKLVEQSILALDLISGKPDASVKEVA